ncbi:MAG TPA: Smr/MutS family protein [Chitinophagales bacterium]|nr:Smr/MutS family protein [Chitinophagales bacterium]
MEGRIEYNELLMGKKKKNKDVEKPEPGVAGFDPEVLRQYMMGATNPGFSNKITMAEDVIDLHLEKTSASKAGRIAPEDALFHQLDEFEKALDKAIAAGKLEMRVVHGLGKGKLKAEVFKLLDKHPQVKRYSNDYSQRYGYGSTVVYFY